MTGHALDREEYIEQEYFFRVYRERLEESIPSQEILQLIHEEVLATTKLPMAIEFLKSEILLNGRISDGMRRLTHYFAPFQSFVMERAEDDRSKFDQRTALLILEREAKYRAGDVTPAGLFIYQFECISRNRLGYDQGMQAMAQDPVYSPQWSEWIRSTRLRLGVNEFNDLIYFRSECYLEELQRRRAASRREPADANELPAPLFGAPEGRIARANRGRDPLLMFAALQRQLGYPEVPKPVAKPAEPLLHPAVEQRIYRLEMRLKLLEQESKGGIDLSQFMPPHNFDTTLPAPNEDPDE